MFILLIFLTAASVWDLKERCIPVWVFVLPAVMMVLLEIGCITNEVLGTVNAAGNTIITAECVGGTVNKILIEKLGGMAVGFVLLAVSKLTHGQIGEGDGIAFVITGFCLGFEENFLLLLEALLFSSVWSVLLMLMKKINLKTSLPFVPFVLTAFVIRIVPIMSF